MLNWFNKLFGAIPAVHYIFSFVGKPQVKRMSLPSGLFLVFFVSLL